MLFSDFLSLAQHYSVTVTTWECNSNDEVFFSIWLLEHMESIWLPISGFVKPYLVQNQNIMPTSVLSPFE